AAERVIAETMSPFCPGLTLANCTSPQAESLRVAVRARIAGGEPAERVQAALVTTYGDAVRGAPAPSGFGLVAYVLPALLLLVGALVIGRWLRRATARGARTGDGGPPTSPDSARHLPLDP
ncbi:MAG: cytochrome c-type biogenesis protein CcmH, partial [Gemmatimonadaceae bacterium]|nr:cytochrome c-type biogenesis protein CcmH [Gemmatimonadaceae bacterium]